MVLLYIVLCSKAVVSLIPLSWQTGPQGEGRAAFFKKVACHILAHHLHLGLKPAGTLKPDQWSEGTAASLRHKGISYCRAGPRCAYAITDTHSHCRFRPQPICTLLC